MSTLYVLGAAFTPSGDVVMIRKNRPDWQAGKHTFVGGKVEVAKGEFPMNAMQREFLEETGVNHADWKRCAALYGKDWTVLVYSAQSAAFEDVATVTDEEISIATWERFHELAAQGELVREVATIFHFARESIGRNIDMRIYC